MVGTKEGGGDWMRGQVKTVILAKKTNKETKIMKQMKLKNALFL